MATEMQSPLPAGAGGGGARNREKRGTGGLGKGVSQARGGGEGRKEWPPAQATGEGAVAPHPDSWQNPKPPPPPPHCAIPGACRQVWQLSLLARPLLLRIPEFRGGLESSSDLTDPSRGTGASGASSRGFIPHYTDPLSPPCVGFREQIN